MRLDELEVLVHHGLLKAHYRTSAGVAGVRDERPSSTRALSSLPPKKNHRFKLVGGMGDGSARNERK